MTTQTEALKLALEALDLMVLPRGFQAQVRCKEAYEAIKEALAQPAVAEQHKQEPDVYIPADALRQLKGTSLLILRSVPLYGYRGDGLTPLYTTPPQRKPLTDEQIMAIGKELGLKCELGGNPNIDFDYARAIEAAHGIKGDA